MHRKVRSSLGTQRVEKQTAIAFNSRQLARHAEDDRDSDRFLAALTDFSRWTDDAVTVTAESTDFDEGDSYLDVDDVERPSEISDTLIFGMNQRQYEEELVHADI